MTKHEWWTVVGLAVAAALAMAAVISTIAWIIRNRLSSRRRKNNLQVRFCLNKQYNLFVYCHTSPYKSSVKLIYWIIITFYY